MATKDESPTKMRDASPNDGQGSPKKRRKVNHACIYCRRSHMTCDLERPCQRCVKRSIGHLCHDEPRESPKSQKVNKENIDGGNEMQIKQDILNPSMIGPSLDPQSVESQFLQTTTSQPASNAHLVRQQMQPPSSIARQNGVFGDNPQQAWNYGDWTQGQFSNVPSFPPYMFNAPDITDEYNMLNDFLHNSLLEDGTIGTGDNSRLLNADPSLNNTLAASTNNVVDSAPPSLKKEVQEDRQKDPERSPRVNNTVTTTKGNKSEKEDEKLYMNIADPSGNDTPQERMNKLLQAKYAAGLLKPFNYVQGYARLGKYMESHLQPSSRQKILKQLDKFRPKFRERMQSLTDMQLMFVEMWFERTLMEYDRVFASMAVPSCCWRRTGEIFRGNREMAELIHVPIDQLRDGKVALHEILAEKDLANYWDNFLAIAFDNSQKAMLTTCSLKNPNENAADPEIKCCFSFTIRRDAQHNIPSLIVGNFIPQVSRKS